MNKMQCYSCGFNGKHPLLAYCVHCGSANNITATNGVLNPQNRARDIDESLAYLNEVAKYSKQKAPLLRRG